MSIAMNPEIKSPGTIWGNHYRRSDNMHIKPESYYDNAMHNAPVILF